VRLPAGPTFYDFDEMVFFRKPLLAYWDQVAISSAQPSHSCLFLVTVKRSLKTLPDHKTNQPCKPTNQKKKTHRIVILENTMTFKCL